MSTNVNDIKTRIEKYIMGMHSEDDTHLLDLWLRNDRSLGRWMCNQIENSPTEMDDTVKSRILDSAVHRDYNQSNRKMIWGATACVILMIVSFSIGLILPIGNDTPHNFKVKTAAGESSKITLPDGSSVFLNNLSEVEWIDEGGGRRLTRLNGEAYFDVSTDPDHPFIVDCGDMQVECRGTRFNVSNYSDDSDIKVVLNEGKINVISRDEKIEMKPDMRVVYNKDTHTMHSSEVCSDNYIEWTSGTRRFEGETLEEIMRILSRKYGVSIRIENREISQERFVGSIGEGPLEDVLNFITGASNTEWESRGERIIISAK